MHKALLFAIAIIVLALVFPVGFNILVASRDELSYNAGVFSSTCSMRLSTDPTPGEYCLTIYEITLGNTGTNAQSVIQISLQDAPELWRFESNVVDIVASAKRIDSPVIDYDSTKDQTHIRIEHLQPNRMVDLRLTYLGPEAFEQLPRMSVIVSANGTLIESNPHTTVMSRFIRNMIGFF